MRTLFAFGMRSLVLACAIVMANGSIVRAQAGAVPPYVPRAAVEGTIRIWADEHMATVLERWSSGFRKFHPGVRVEIRLVGNAAAMPGIYHRVADLALLGRETDITDDNGFFKSVGGYQPLKIEPMNGSLDMPGASCAHAVYVHPDNPLQRLTVAQLEAIFGHEHRRGAANIRTWGDLGLKGDWAHRPIKLYAHDIETDPGLHFVRTVLLESRKLNWDNLTEFTADAATAESANVLERRIVHAVAHDRFGMSVGCGGFGGAEVKAVAIAEHERSPYVQATRAAIVARTYPLARRTYAFLNVPPDRNMEPKMKEFMRYVLSREGQADVQRSGAYLPLSDSDASDQLRLLR